MNETLLGSFVFIKDSKTTLTGTYFNKELGIPQLETARLDGTEIPDNFVGTYESTWTDPWDTTLFPSQLVITPVNEEVFKLTWTVNRTISFWGYGFIRNKMLVGHYTNTKI